MSARDDGGPAFPIPGLQDHVEFNGMSLRDYFAAKAMQRMWTNVDLLRELPSGREAKMIATMAYEQADAMLKTRTE